MARLSKDYVSDVDLFLATLRESLPVSQAQQAEVDKAARITRLATETDHPLQAPADEIWRDF